jgi:hypothetical protein
VRDIAGTPASRIDGGRDPGQFDVRPAQQHREGAEIIRIPAEIGIEMNTHRSLTRPFEPPSANKGEV